MVEYTSSQYKASTGTTVYYKDGKIVGERTGKGTTQEEAAETYKEGTSVARILVEPTKSGSIARSRPATTSKDILTSTQQQVKQEALNEQVQRIEKQYEVMSGDSKKPFVAASKLTPSPTSYGITAFNPLQQTFYTQKEIVQPRVYGSGWENVKATYGAIGQNIVSFVKREPPKYKFVTPLSEKKWKSARAVGKVVTFGAEKPFTSAAILVAGTSLNGVGLKRAAIGTGVTAGVGAVGGQVARYKARDFTKIEGYQEILRKGYEAEEPYVSKWNIAYDVSPSFVSKSTQQKFTQSIYDQLRAKGYSDAEAYRLTQQAYSYRRTKGTTAAVQTITIGATAEGIGRAGFKKYGIRGIQPAGFYEGFSETIKSYKAKDDKADFKKAATYGAVGGATAVGFSYAIVKGRKTIGAAANVLDLSEAPSDVAFDIAQKTTKKKALKTVVLTPTTTFTTTKTKIKSELPKGTKEFKGVKVEGIELTPKKPSYNFVYTPTSVLPKSKISAEIPVKPQPQIPIKPSPIVPVPSITSTVTKTSPVVPVPVATKISPMVKTTVPVATTTFTGKMFPYIPKFRGGGGFGRRRTKITKTKQFKTYTPSGFAAAFSIKANKRSKAGEFTGLGVRGIIEPPKRLKRKRGALF